MSPGHRRNTRNLGLNKKACDDTRQTLNLHNGIKKTGPAYTSIPLIQYIPRLIHYEEGELADAHKFLIAVINEISESTLHLFQSQMSSTVQCSLCKRLANSIDNTQDFSLQITVDRNMSVEDSLHDFFEPKTPEGENTY